MSKYSDIFTKFLMQLLIQVIFLILAVNSYAQGFTINTDVAPASGLNEYRFTLDYFSSGSNQTLQSDVWQWSFFLDTDVPSPTSVVSPSGWQHTYDPSSGEFIWFTEGPQGAVNGDYGSYVLSVGNQLSGFILRSSLEPDLSIAFATDTQANTDLNFVTLPANLPSSAVPEPNATLYLGASALGLLSIVWGHKRRKRAVS